MTSGSPNSPVILGIMSGTSLDGLDLALCEFVEQKGVISFKIHKSTTIDYSTEWRDKLTNVKNASAEDYFTLHAEYGRFIGEHINSFLIDTKVKPAAIASHGHTVFHQPKKGFSTQIGCGATIAAVSGITTICDFRSLDVALKGQGAPLVPIGDQLLFKQYQACLNIGGIANISFDKERKRIAYDVCVANMALNFLAEKAGYNYDEGGQMARSGKVDKELLSQLNQLEFYKNNGVKSLGREWFESNFLVLLNKLSNQDLLATCTEHIAYQIASDLKRNNIKNVLVTGGGAFNSFLIERIKNLSGSEIILPDAQTINFKEALIFGFLGFLRINDNTNTLCSVTGALSDSVGGAVYRMK